MSFSYLVSTDLDGTLLDHYTYSFEAAKPGLLRCSEFKVPVLINTSKTYSEVACLQKSIGIDAPLIVENGSALIAPERLCLQAKGGEKLISDTRSEGFRQIVFGVQREEIIRFIQGIRRQYTWKFEGFNDWTIGQIAEHTGLNLASAEQAAQKEFSEPFVWNDSELNLAQFIKQAEFAGLTVLKGGRYYHLQGETDKAKPLRWLQKFGGQAFAGMWNGNHVPKLVCLGDSNNDVAMLNVADYPICVRSPVADFPILSTKAKVQYTQGYGPVGWTEAILALFK